MGMRFLVALAGGVIASGLGGCSQNLKEQSHLLLEENQDLRDELAQRNGALDSQESELAMREQRISDLQRQLDDANWALQNQPAPTVTATYTDPGPDPFSEISGVTGSYKNGEITATVESDVLFSAGKSDLRTSAKRSLDAVADVLNSSYNGKTIRVAGYTDTDPIRKSGYKSNYHLGFERAYAVREYLVSRGVPTERIYVASHGPHQARSTKKESRRVEIAVVTND